MSGNGNFLYEFLYRLTYADENEQWSLRTWVHVFILTAVALLAAWGLHHIPGSFFWAAALAVELTGLVLITLAILATECERANWRIGLFFLFLQAGSVLLATGSIAAISRRKFPVTDVEDGIVLHLIQATAQAFAYATLGAFSVVLLRQTVVPFFVALHSLLNRWYNTRFRKPRVVYVQDLASEAQGSCNICLNDLVEDEVKEEGLLRLCCGHVFHSACIQGWLDRKRTCPMCRRRITDIRRCTKLVHRPLKESPRTNTGASHTMVSLLEGNMMVLPSVVVSSPRSAGSVSSSSTASSSHTIEARSSSGRPRAVTLGAVPEVGARSSFPAPVELRPHAYRPPRSSRTTQALRSSNSSPALSARTVDLLPEEESGPSQPRRDAPINAWSPS